jgi:hypothetical protein
MQNSEEFETEPEDLVSSGKEFTDDIRQHLARLRDFELRTTGKRDSRFELASTAR